MCTSTGTQLLLTLPLLRPHQMLALQAQMERVIRTTCWDAVHPYRCRADRTLLYRHVRLHTHASTGVMRHYIKMPASGLQHNLIEKFRF